jgi:26S proteasome non-ATPase regulatory subunit 10
MTCCIGDTAVALLKEEADFTLKTTEGQLAIDLAPDKEVRTPVIR